VDQSLRLAALASAAVPGLDPIAVQQVFLGEEEHFDVAFIQDSQQRRWVIRAPRSEVDAARMDASLAMLGLLVRRVPFAVPAAKGFAPIPGIGRASVHSYIPGEPIDLAALHPGHPLTAELGRVIAMIHNIDRALYDEAGLPAYDAESYRKRHLAEIDRGAATGRVPAGLLARWEEALDDVRLWRFAPTPVHGALHGGNVLVTFPDRADTTKATIRGVIGWESAKIADPADDFAALVASTRAEVVDSVFHAYAQVRVERPDPHLLARARLASELELLGQLMRAVSNRDDVVTEALTARLRRLDDAVHDERLAKRLRIVPATPVSEYAPPPAPREVQGGGQAGGDPLGGEQVGTEQSADKPTAGERAHDDPDDDLATSEITPAQLGFEDDEHSGGAGDPDGADPDEAPGPGGSREPADQPASHGDATDVIDVIEHDVIEHEGSGETGSEHEGSGDAGSDESHDDERHDHESADDESPEHERAEPQEHGDAEPPGEDGSEGDGSEQDGSKSR